MCGISCSPNSLARDPFDILKFGIVEMVSSYSPRPVKFGYCGLQKFIFTAHISKPDVFPKEFIMLEKNYQENICVWYSTMFLSCILRDGSDLCFLVPRMVVGAHVFAARRV